MTDDNTVLTGNSVLEESKERIGRFMEYRDASGVSNREKIAEHQHVIRRVPTTDQSRGLAGKDGNLRVNNKIWV